MLKVHRGVLKIPHQYKEKIIDLFVAEKIYAPEDQNIFI